MATANLIVTQVGPHTSIQDSRRRGMMRFGVPASGPMDRIAFAAANAALGNPTTAPVIEVSMAGLALSCVTGDVTIAVTGGGFQVAVDAATCGSWSVINLQAGASLVIRPGHWGSWAYLAFAGQLQAASWLGSVSTHGPSGFGGGRLVAGQQITIENAERRDQCLGEIPCPVSARPRPAVHAVLGPQQQFFPAEAIASLFSQPFTLSDAYDRMGVRLAGPLLRPAGKLDMPSQAILRGSIQVSGDGIPTVLLADHQTTGGYPKIATIIADDLDGFAQLRSRNQVTFNQVTPEAAISLARTRHEAQSRYLANLGTRARLR